MDQSTLAWLSLTVFGFLFGCSSGPMALLRIGIALTMLCGLGVLFAETSGHDRLAYWCVIGMLSVLVAFLVAMVGAVTGAAARKAFRSAPPVSPPLDRRAPVQP